MQKQTYIFFAFILNGFLIGLVFDCFRVLRKCFKTTDLITFLEDLLFGILSGLLIMFSTFKFNDGAIRFYTFLGVILGTILYLLLFSKTFTKTLIFIMELLKKLLYWIIIIPFEFLKRMVNKIVYKPIVFICLNVNNWFKKIKKYRIKRIKKKATDEI